ncbi:MAG: ABC transporter substrate-binding protein [Clostridia bacterium]|nr:ABC transporter substrate-binding protein [Clostridia bacterium]
MREIWSLFEVALYCHVEGQKNYPIIFGQLTNKDGSFLVGRKPEPDFKWSDLNGKHVLAGRPGGVPAMMLQYVCNNAGLYHGENINLDTTVAFDAMVGAFDGDTKYDYCTMFEPTASEHVLSGRGYIVASVGDAGGAVPYTAFSASKSYLEKNRDTALAFLRAVFKGYKYMTEHTPEESAKHLTASFVDTPEASIAASLKSYLDIEAFAKTPVLKESDFNHLMDIMENAGTLPSRADFDKAVDNSIAAEIML